MSSARARLTRMLLNKSKPAWKQPEPPSRNRKWGIVRGDKVQVVDKMHSDYEMQGIVLKVIRQLDRVIVSGVNVRNKHIKGDKDRGIPGRTIQKERTLKYSAVNLVCPVSGRPTRISKKFLEDGTKVRVAKVSGAIIPRPEILTRRKGGVKAPPTSSCTAEEDVWSVSYMLKPKK
jgi:large subunit ribosomal protein L24